MVDLLSFEGRANRAVYFWHQFLDGFVIFALMAVILVTSGSWIGALAVAVLGGIAAIAVTVRRFHDIERPGWHVFLLMIPLYNIYLSLVLLFAKGMDGPNRYGDDPLMR